MKFNLQKENLRCVRQFYAHVANGEFFAASESLDPEVEWKEPNLPGLWFAGTHRGPEAVRKEVLDPMQARFARYQVKMKKFFPVGDHVIAIGRIHGQSNATGKKLDLPTAHFWTLRGGKAVRFEGYHDNAAWLDILGEPAPDQSRLAA